MKINERSMLNKFLQLLVVTFVTAICYYLLISFDVSGNESPIHFTNVEIFIAFPLFMAIIFLPYVFFYGVVTFALKYFIEKILGFKNLFLSILFYVVISIILIPILPKMISTAADTTTYQFFLNPYDLIPFLGAVILILFEVKRKKRELS